MKESFETELQIENAKDEIRLLQKDLKIDRQIKKKELDNKVKLLDERKDVDLLRCDYMAAYARLDNVQGLIDIKSSSEDKISELESQIKVQKIIEISLYECISRKREFEHFIDKYNNEVQKLDTEVQAKKRYQNDILEIERNKFEEDRAKNESDRQDERKEYYPEILDIKNKSQKKINDLKNAFDSSSDDEKKEKVEKEEKVREALLRHRKLYQKTIKLIDGSHKKEKGSSSYFNMIDTSSFTDQIISILDNYANEANAILKELFNHKGMENPKLPGKTKFEKSMRKAKKDNEREKAYAQLQKDAKASLNKSKSTFSSIVQEEMPMTDKETDKYLKEYNEVKKTLIAEEAIRANDELAPYLEKLENIEKERDKKVEANKQHLEDYKKQYTDTIKAIEEDYQSKIDELNKLKEERENERQSENADVRQLIKESTDKIAELTDKENQANKEFIDSTSRDRQNKVQSLSDEISEINRELDNKKAQLDKENQAFRDQKSIEAKANIEKYNLEKTKNDQQLKNKIKQMEKERDSRFRSMDSDTLAIKIAYNERVEKLIEQTENIKADKELRFGELLDETKNDTISAYEKVRKPVDEFSKSMDLLNEEIINKTISLTNTVLENESSSFEEIVNEVDSSINGKEGA